MSITGQQVETAIQIMNLVFKAQKMGPSVRDVMNFAEPVAGLLTNNLKDQHTLAEAIISRMITIRAEVK